MLVAIIQLGLMRIIEAGSHHADNPVRFAAKLQRPAQNRRVRAEQLLPERVADHRYIRAPLAGRLPY